MADTYTSPGAHSFFTISGQENTLLTNGGPTLSGEVGTIYNFNIVITDTGLGNNNVRLQASPADYVRDQSGNLYVTKSYQYTANSQITVVKDGATYVYDTNLLNVFSFTPVDENGNETGPEIQMFTHHRFAENANPISKDPADAPNVSFRDAVAENTSMSITVTADRPLENSLGADYRTSSPEVWPYTYSSGTSVVCFASGTLIETDTGEVSIESLTVGDLVKTLDHGLQSIRWIGSSKRAAIGDIAPILIRKGALGNTRDLMVSPQHRMLVRSAQAVLLFGEEEVFVTAKSLINDQSIRRVEGGEVEYFHILFDHHEVIFAEGCPSESFHLGEQGWNTLNHASKAEILELFPEIVNDNFDSYGSTARQSLKHYEGLTLASAIQ